MIMQDNTEGLKRYLQGVTDINKKNESGMPLLHYATLFDKPDVAEVLLSHGADVNIGMNGMPALFYVKSIRMLNVLKKYKVDIYLETESGMTALFMISKASVLDVLIKSGLDPLQESMGMTALVAAKEGIKTLEKIYNETDNDTVRATYKESLDDIRGKIKYLAQYESRGPQPELLVLANKGDLSGVKRQIKKVNALTTIDDAGYTALHVAARADKLEVVKYLSTNKNLLNAKNKYGKKALDLVISSKSESAKYLSCQMNRYCKDPKSFALKINTACTNVTNINQCEIAIKQDVHGLFASIDIKGLARDIRFKQSCKKFNYIKCKRLESPTNDRIYAQKIDAAIQLHTPSIEKKFIISCGENGSMSKCEDYLKHYPGFKSKPEIEYAMLFHGQKCRIKESGWLYKSANCKAGYAHGSGAAVNVKKQLSYAGQFAAGLRVNGKISYQGKPMYDGDLKAGKPNGKGVCFHEGEPEECKYYSGKRIDSLYKQRIEMAKQQKIMDQKLAQMQQAQDKQLKQMQLKMSQQPARGSNAKTMGDVIMDKAMDKAMDKVFDSLF